MIAYLAIGIGIVVLYGVGLAIVVAILLALVLVARGIGKLLRWLSSRRRARRLARTGAHVIPIARARQLRARRLSLKHLSGPAKGAGSPTSFIALAYRGLVKSGGSA